MDTGGKNNTMKRKITLYFMIINFLTLGLFMMGFCIGLTQYYYHTIANTFQTYAEGVSPVWKNEVDLTNVKLRNYSDDIIKSYQYKEGELQLLSREGVLIQSSTGFYKEVRYSLDPSILEYKSVYKIEKNEVTKEKVLALYTPLIYKGQVIGVLRYITSLTNVNNLIRNLMGYGLIICIMVAFIVFLVSLRLGNSIVKPLRDIIYFTQKMAEGQYKNKIEKTYPHELGELAKMLNYMGDEILKTDRMKNDFISSISHELRTPLTGIKGWVETMQAPEGLTEEESQFGLTMINNESERLISLVENLLDFSRYQSDRIKLVLSVVPVDQLIHEVTFQLQKKMEKKGIHLITETTPAEITADKDKLKQVVLNVLENAIKFSNKEDEIHIIQSISQEKLLIKIIDHGIGIAEDNLNYIMDSFYKIDSKSIGAGLGLAISKNIIEMHQGFIQIQSEYGKGTAVIITIPIN